MGISLEEYLKNRQACAHCESTDNQEYCTTTLLSSVDTCIFYNAMTKNGLPHHPDDVLLLQKFRALHTESTVLEYYIKSSEIVRDLKSQTGDQTDLWLGITLRYVNPIINDLKNNDSSAALIKLQKMLDDLEKGA
jgi:hypothetical protein